MLQNYGSSLTRSGKQPDVGSALCAGVSLRAFEENAGLRDSWQVLSLSRDRRGDIYVSTMEAKHVRLMPVHHNTSMCRKGADLAPIVGAVPLHRDSGQTLIAALQSLLPASASCTLVLHSRLKSHSQPPSPW